MTSGEAAYRQHPRLMQQQQLVQHLPRQQQQVPEVSRSKRNQAQLQALTAAAQQQQTAARQLRARQTRALPLPAMQQQQQQTVQTGVRSSAQHQVLLQERPLLLLVQGIAAVG